MRATIFAVILSIGTCVGNEHFIGSQRSLCTDKPEGSFAADPESCSNFFICYNSEAVSQSCERGSYFDSTNLYCLPDTDNVCPQPECSVDGAYSPNPTSCSQFYICYDEKLVEQSCAAGSYFDKTELYCLPDTDNVCPQPECSVNGAYSPHATSCSQFYICYDGKLVEQSCAAGSYFDKTELYCLPDTDNVCPQPECSVNGAYSPHPTSCSQFYICYDGKLVEQSCAAGSYFDKTELYCLPDTDNVCPQPECSVNGAYSPHPTSCSQFYICYDGKLVEQSCAAGSYFDKTELYCLPDTDNVCPQPECSVNGAYSPHPTSCSQFYICYDGKLVEQSCAAGSYFNKTELYCLPDTDNVCPLPKCSVDGAYSPHPTSCSQFYICYDGKLVEQSCAAGSYFNKTELYCLPDTDNVCPQPECSVNGAYSPHPTSCSQFYICYDGKLVEQSCSAGSYFNKTELYCLPDTDNVCPLPKCSVDGAYSPHPTSCSQFYICYDGKLVEQSCAAGSYFNKTELYCLPDTDNVCPLPKCSVDGAYSPHPTSCSQFYICYDGKLVEQSCAAGSYFNKTELYCLPDTDNVCPQPQCTIDGAISPYPGQCALFYVCYNGSLVEQTCGEGSYFDQENLYCLPDTDNICWSSNSTSTEQPCTCVGGYTDGEFVASPDSCYSYYICSDGELVEQNCGYGNYFDNSTKRCAQDITGECWPSSTVTTTTATPDPCTSCEGGYNEGDFIASPDSCYLFFVCERGELVELSCGYGNYFDNCTKVCERDSERNCWTVETTTTESSDC